MKVLGTRVWGSSALPDRLDAIAAAGAIAIAAAAASTSPGSSDD